ncbi:type III PLP-dependent enzyme [Aspergillus candidus]|uniref:ornithine decarboxylase n=1 Tax=Aspergillus candidus TaxID=41067 RepID=A0A2I2F882_ASPCN|nr:ornithine decarboxylase [Aspergillus candidus]PLB36846.1 ornithine decarboxylase [Aspergillus candidus]
MDPLIDFLIQTRLSNMGQNGVTIEDDEPFFVADLGQVIRQHRCWKRNLPDVHPFYAVKCNSDPNLLRLLAELGTGFDCASIEELRSVLALGVDPARIIFANPCKAASSLVFAQRAGVSWTTFDNLDELDTIKRYHPNALLALRIFASDSDALIDLSKKYGAPIDSTWRLLQRAQALGLEVSGVSFHVGTGASNLASYIKAIQQAKTVVEQGKALGFVINVLDIGGGFQDSNFEKFVPKLQAALRREFPTGMRFMAEPGRYYARSAYTLVCKVISRRLQTGAQPEPDMLYQNDGVYGSFMNVLIEKEVLHPSLVSSGFHSLEGGSKRHKGKRRYSIWGPTCDSTDRVVKEMDMESEVKVGDWLKYTHMGAYTTATATQFNGFPSHRHVTYLNSELIGHRKSRKSMLEHLYGGWTYKDAILPIPVRYDASDTQ